MNKGIEQARNEGIKRNQSGFVKVVFRRVTKFLAIAAIIIVLLLSPFWGSIVYNEIRLIIFDSQMSKIEKLFEENGISFEVVAKGRTTKSNTGSCSCMMFQSTRTYRLGGYQTEIQEIVDLIKEFAFKSAKQTEYYYPPKSAVYLIETDSQASWYVIVNVDDGAYNSNLDIRYW